MRAIRKTIFAAFLVTLVTAGTASSGMAQFATDNAAIRDVVRRIQTRTDSLQRAVQNAADRNNYRIDDIDRLILDFESVVNQLDRRLISRRAVTSSEVQVVLDRGALIDNFFVNNRLGAGSRREWQTIRTGLDQLANYVGFAITLFLGLAVVSLQTPAQQSKPNEADVHFMTGMIPHHAQAVLIAGWAKTHTSNRQLQILCERIVVAQRDEIEIMRTWLADRGLPVPEATSTRHRMTMNGVTHEMLMPGMLTPEQMKQLDNARGAEFDRLFLTFMIQHHQGAITMVEQLLASPGAAQDGQIFKFAADVNADQTTEINRMTLMLEDLKRSSQ